MNHYRMTGQERQIKLLSTGSFSDAALCGNGDFHATLVREVDHVDCDKCLEVIASAPSYLNTPRKAGETMECRADWTLHGVITREGLTAGREASQELAYAIWTDGTVWQITGGKPPENEAGYNSLDALLGLKGLRTKMVTTPGGETLKMYEVTLPGFDGASDETDDLVVWLAARTAAEVKTLVAGSGAKFCGQIDAELSDADFELPRDLEGFRLRLEGTDKPGLAP